MERYTAGYSYTDFNFVIQNVKGKKNKKINIIHLYVY